MFEHVWNVWPLRNAVTHEKCFNLGVCKKCYNLKALPQNKRCECAIVFLFAGKADNLFLTKITALLLTVSNLTLTVRFVPLSSGFSPSKRWRFHPRTFFSYSNFISKGNLFKSSTVYVITQLHNTQKIKLCFDARIAIESK